LAMFSYSWYFHCITALSRFTLSDAPGQNSCPRPSIMLFRFVTSIFFRVPFDHILQLRFHPLLNMSNIPLTTSFAAFLYLSSSSWFTGPWSSFHQQSSCSIMACKSRSNLCTHSYTTACFHSSFLSSQHPCTCVSHAMFSFPRLLPDAFHGHMTFLSACPHPLSVTRSHLARILHFLF
jgi:hypothetical protein